jgi:predicted RNase H-like HicB family nuclease
VRSPGNCVKDTVMKLPFSATIWREGDWYGSQRLEVDVASQGESEEEALANLKEALELHFDAPRAGRPPKVCTLELEVGAAQAVAFPRDQTRVRGCRPGRT